MLRLLAENCYEAQKVKTAFFPVGESEVELLESTAPDGPISKYIEKKGEGIQHVAFRVKDIDSALSELKQKGIRKDGNLIFTDDMSKVPEDQQAGVKVPDAFDLTPVTPGGGI